MEGLDSLTRIRQAFRDSRRVMPPRALKRTVRKIDDSGIDESVQDVLRELGRRNAELDEEEECSLASSTASSFDDEEEDDNKEDDESAQPVRNRPSFLSPDYRARPRFFDNLNVGPDMPLAICPDCKRLVPDFVRSYHEAYTHGSSEGLRGVLKSVGESLR